MKRHEQRCTMNPNRDCGVCGLVEGLHESIPKLVAMLPNPSEYTHDDGLGGQWFTDALSIATNDALARLREATGNCPACVLAAIRQAGIPVPMVTDFDWAKEMAVVWTEINDRNAQECHHG
jgi:hypothetical protein